MIKKLSDTLFQVDSDFYLISDLQRRVSTRATGANVHKLRNNFSIVYGYFHTLEKDEILDFSIENGFKTHLKNILLNT